MKIELSDDEALVLFEWLYVILEDNKPTVPKEIEASLCTILGQLECELVEPFRSDYGELVDQAAGRIRLKFCGSEDGE